MSKQATLDVKCDGVNLIFEDHGGYESRHQSTMKLIYRAWDKHIKGSQTNQRSFSLFTDDIFNPYCDYSFAIKNKDQLNKCMPHYVFEAWPECGIHDYQETFNSMVSFGAHDPSDDRAFWIGAISHLINPAPRILGAQVANKNPNKLDFRVIEWKNRGMQQTSHTHGYVSLQDHCKYRVLIDFGGAGYSGRIPLLLASGRPVILVGHPQEAWFYWDGTLIPWTHFIPCGVQNGDSLSFYEIETAINWTFENRTEAENIGKQGQQYAQKYLTRDAVVDLIANIIKKHPSVY